MSFLQLNKMLDDYVNFIKEFEKLKQECKELREEKNILQYRLAVYEMAPPNFHASVPDGGGEYKKIIEEGERIILEASLYKETIWDK